MASSNPPLTSPVLITTGSGIGVASPPQILGLQTPQNAPLSPALTTITNGLNIPPRAIDRLSNFPEEIYSLNSTDNLVRFLMVLLGQAGAGQWRSRALQARLQTVMQGANFYELDGFYGALFGLGRMSTEQFPFNPYTQLATFDQWSGVYQQDSSYRTRIAQFGKAISLGASAIGMQLVAEAVLQCPCEILESWETADVTHRTWGEVQDIGTWGDLQAYTWGQLEEGTQSTTVNRKLFTVVPYRTITQEESYALMQVLNVVKPADAIANISLTGFDSATQVNVRGVAADSSYWQMIESVIPNPQYENLYNISDTSDQYGFFQVLHPPFSEYQGEEIVYNPDISGIIGYTQDTEGNVLATTNVGAVTFLDGTITYYPPTQAAATRYFSAAGRLVSDGILQSAPYSADVDNVPVPTIVANTGSTAPFRPQTISAALPQTLYVDGIAVPDLVSTLQDTSTTQGWKLQIATGNQDYWATPVRAISDPTVEVLEIRLVAARLINNISFLTANFPSTIQVQVWNSTNSTWTTVSSTSIFNSVPNQLPSFPQVAHEDPQHSAPGCWNNMNVTIDPVSTSKVRFLLTRIPNGNGPVINTLQSSNANPVVSTPVPYSLALQDIVLGYNIYQQSDLPTSPIFTSDFLESQVEWSVRQELPANVLNDVNVPWRSAPQIASDAVVNMYLDTRDYKGDGQLIDRFFIDPLYNDVHCTLYYSDESTLDLPSLAESTPLVPPASVNVGSVIGTTAGLVYNSSNVQYTKIENVAVQFDPNGPWWWGMVFQPGYSSVEADGQCLWDTGEGLNLTVQPIEGSTQAAITISTADGQSASTNVAFQVGDTIYTTVVYLPDGSDELEPGIYVFASVNVSSGGEIVSRYALGIVQAEVHPIFDSFNSAVNLFGYYVPTLVVENQPVNLFVGALQADPVPANMTMLSMVIKQNVATIEQINTYTQDYASYTQISPFYTVDPTTNTNNSLVRFNPVYITTANQTGMLGGPGYFYPQLSWTPVVRDYTLQKGFMFLNPTKAAFWKFEFTNLSAQPLNSFVAVNQPYQTHTGIVPGLVQSMPTPPINSTGNAPAGSAYNQSSASSQDASFSDSLFVNAIGSTTNPNATSVAGGTITPPTATQVAVDQTVQSNLASTAWYWQYQSWFQGQDAPRFVSTGVHNYQGTTATQSAQVGYFVALNALSAWVLDFGSNDDTAVYDVTFADDTYLETGSLTWSLDSNDLYTDFESSFPTICESTSILSTSPIVGVQFATQQSDAIEIANDDGFQSPLLIDTDWTNTEIAHGVGDALLGYTTLSYLIDTYQVAVYRNFNAGTISETPQQQGRLVRPDMHPIFDERDLIIPAPSGADFGGLASSFCNTGTEGNIWAAVRLVVDTQLDQPLTLQIVDAGPAPDFDSPTVLASVDFQPAPGQTIEQTLGYELGSVMDSGNPVYAQIVQYGNVSANQWTVDKLSVFDEGILWKFSLDGGETFYTAFDIRNNAYGMLTFPFPGTQLVWRAEGTREGVHVNYLRIRPVYANQQFLPPEAISRGPNVALVDQWPPIEEDPLFNGWHNPVPFWWFLGYQYSLLAVSGVPNTTPESTFFIRQAVDNISGSLSDAAGRTYYAHRKGTIHLSTPADSATRDFSGDRGGSDSTSVSDSAQAYTVYVHPGGIIEPDVWPHGGVKDE